MPKISEWSGNEHSRKALGNSTNQRLNDFCNCHKSIYIFGTGKIGTGFHNYLSQCNVPLEGFVTSVDFDDFRKIYMQGETGIVMGLSDENLSDVIPLINGVISDNDLFIADSEYRESIGYYNVEFIRDNLTLTVYLVSHCNLGCKGCAVFSPIACQDCYDYIQLESDFKQLKCLDLKIKTISFSGGEPYLHPNLFKILKSIRMLYPSAVIEIVTNGTLLKRLSKGQIDELVGLDILNRITMYPALRGEVEPFCRTADSAGIKYSIVDYEDTKYFTQFKLDMDESAPIYDFYNCHKYSRHQQYLNLFRGKIYRCGRPMAIRYFNEYFNTDFKVRDGDYLDIYKTTAEDIYKFKLSRAPFCAYHNSANYSLMEWGLSERKLEEWVHLG